ncbi:hypothetical protein GCM10011594_41600 [Nakamurella endophytica]|uniref:Fibronectin type III domain-containing protein n=1 Tax=Nakamurella endophytica TaxID=1748367 RepID=A0A917TC35_9ACTN|nr:hypothetical protein GCM10011594_41600 [Nakamurella endophytica]
MWWVRRALAGAVCLVVAGATVLVASPPSAAAAATVPTPTVLTVNSLPGPVDVDGSASPQFGWQLATGMQVAYQVQLAGSAAELAAGADVWDSGPRASADSSNVRYAGPALDRAAGYFWRVRVWNGRGGRLPEPGSVGLVGARTLRDCAGVDMGRFLADLGAGDLPGGLHGQRHLCHPCRQRFGGVPGEGLRRLLDVAVPWRRRQHLGDPPHRPGAVYGA